MLTQLITQERAQKLDLLGHLIRNLRQSLVIFGPKGIGKTTFLHALKDNKSESGAILLLQASERLAFEQIQEQLFRELEQYVSGGRVETLAQLLQIFDKHNQYVVLLMDNAGLMVPGLITTLVQYAARFNNLRIVFALTQEDLEAKHKTDREIEDCHFLEIPPLSSSQCGEYLQYLNSTSDTPISNSLINEVMVERIYKKSGGVPGKVVEAMPGLSTGGISGSGWIYALVVAGITSVVVGFLLWRNIENVVYSGASAPPASSSAAPLEIPGQIKSEPQVNIALSATNTAVGDLSTAQVQRLPRPEINNSKPDYYSGFARVRDADALDEFKDKNAIHAPSGDQSDQVKIEIITPEPPPKEVIIANALPEVVRELAPRKDAVTLNLSATENHAQDAKIPEEKMDVQSKRKAEVSPRKMAITEPKLTEKENKSEIKPVKNNLDLAKVAVTPKVSKNELKKEPKPTLKETVLPREENKIPAADTLVEDIKLLAEQGKSGENTKTKPENVKLPVLMQPKLAQEPKQEIVEKKLEKIVQVDESAKKPVIKPEQDVTAKPEVAEPPREEGGVKAEAKNQPEAVEKLNTEATGLAKLGVVMKYKSEEVKVEPPATSKAEKKEQATDNPVNAETKPATKASNAKYTLQLMTFSQPQSLQNFISKYGSMGGSLRYFTVNKDGAERYVVVFGAYDSVAQANAAKQKLPPEFKQALARKM